MTGDRCTLCHTSDATILVRVTLKKNRVTLRELPYCNDCFHRYLQRRAASPVPSGIEARVMEDS